LRDDRKRALPEVGHMASVAVVLSAELVEGGKRSENEDMKGDLLSGYMFKLSYRSLETFSTVILNRWIQGRVLVVQNRQYIRSEYYSSASKVSQPQDCLYRICEQCSTVWKLERERQAFIPL